MRLVIEIPKPWSIEAVPDERGDPMPEQVETDRADWVQGLSEAMMNGGRAWLQGAGLETALTLYIDPIVVPNTGDAVPF
jgi:hypothetical protein